MAGVLSALPQQSADLAIVAPESIDDATAAHSHSPPSAVVGYSKWGSSRILVGAEGGFHAQFSAVEEDSNAEVLELAEAFGS